MPIAKESGGDYTPCPPGTHIARCIAVIALGTQPSELYGPALKVQIGWELPLELLKGQDGEKPMTVSKDYTLSLNKKATLRQHLDSWRGRAFTAEELKGFDLNKILGIPCMLTVVHKTNGEGKIYAAIAGVSGLPKGTVCPPQLNKSVSYEIEDKQNEVFKSLPEWIRKKISQCQEWRPQPDDAVATPPTGPEMAPADDEPLPF